MGYYKEIEKVYVEGKNYSALGTPGEMRKRGVEKTACKEVENNVVKVKIVDYYETSGAIEYGMAVRLLCTFGSGEQVKATVSGMDYMSWVGKHTTVNGITEGEFLFLFKGVTERLVERGGKKHKDHIKEYEKQEFKKKKERKMVVKVGDIVDIYGRSVYLGDFYYFKPNLRKGTVHNQLRKYKLYLQLSDEGSYIGGRLYVESGRTKYNQPTEILGEIEIDFDLLKENARNRMERIYERGVGYERTNGYFKSWRADKKENDKSYVLVNASKNKEDVVYPNKEEILKLAWLCGWNVDEKSYRYKREGGRDNIIPYEYEEVE